MLETIRSGHANPLDVEACERTPCVVLAVSGFRQQVFLVVENVLCCDGQPLGPAAQASDTIDNVKAKIQDKEAGKQQDILGRQHSEGKRRFTWCFVCGEELCIAEFNFSGL